MKIVVQKVKMCKVKILENNVEKSINKGILVLVAISKNDTTQHAEWVANKIVNLRIFPDNEGKMNLSVKDINGDIMIVSNFTLYGDVKRGFRPSFSDSAHPEFAIPIYFEFVNLVKKLSGLKVETGNFGSMMEVELINEGPITLIIER